MQSHDAHNAQQLINEKNYYKNQTKLLPENYIFILSKNIYSTSYLFFTLSYTLEFSLKPQVLPTF